MADLSITIGGDSSDLSEEISRVERQLRTLERRREARVRIGADVGDLDRRISETTSNLSSLRNSLNQTTSSSDRFNRSAANGSNTLTQFSRIAQDAPFGIMGIGNNLTATAESFAQLSSSAGGAGNALRAVGASLLGTGGILLAVSLVTTALTYMSQAGLSVGDVFDQLTGRFDENARALKKASEEGARAASEEIISLKALLSVAQNETKSKQDRLIAVEQLQKQYPGYFGNLSKEKILTGDVATVVKELTNALIAKAIAEKLSADSAEIQYQIYKANARLINAKNDTLREELKWETLLTEARAKAGTSQADLAKITARRNAEVKRTKEAEQEAREAILSGTKAMQQRQDIINKLTASSIKLLETPEKTAKTKKEKSKGFDFEKGFLGGGIVAPGLAVDSPLLRMDIQLDEARMKAIAKLKQWEADFAQFGVNINNILKEGTEAALIGLGESIGNALAESQNVFQAVGASLVNSLGQMISNIGKEMIKFGILTQAYAYAVTALKKAFANPYVAAAAGIALVAVGAALSASSKKIGGGNSGGSSGGSGTTGRDYSSPASSISSGSGGSFTNGSVVFEISGTSLIGVLSNSLAKNSRIGGTLGI